MKNTFIVLLSASLISTFVFMNGPVNVAVSEPTNATSELLESTASQESTFNSADILKETNFSNTNGTNATTTIESTTEATTKSDSTTPDTSLEKTKKVTTFAATADAVEDGSEENPYLVATFADLQNAVKQAIPSGSDALYIQLTADLTYNSESFKFSKNTTINGLKDSTLEEDTTDENTIDDNNNEVASKYYSISYTGSSYANTQISTSADGLTLTFKNISFTGNNSYYGFVDVDNKNTEMIIENMDYMITRGSQPFYSDKDGCTLILRGTNNFSSNTPSGGYGGEFQEGYTKVIFDTGSVTDIYNDSPNSDGIFYGKQESGTNNVQVKDNAMVSITSMKNSLFYGNTNTFTVGKNSTFIYEKIITTQGNGAADNKIVNDGKSITMNFDNNSIIEFRSSYLPIDMKTTTITADEPNYILFDFPIDNTNFISAGSVALTRNKIPDDETQTTDADYHINYISNGALKSLVSHFPMTSTQTIDENTPSDTTQRLIYEPTLALSGVEGSSTPSSKESTVTADITGFTPTDRTLTSVDYFLTATRPFDTNTEPITSDEAQSKIEGIFTSDDETLKKATFNLASPTDPTTASLTDVGGGDYYLYARATGETTDGFSSSSLWVETTVSVKKIINVTVPTGIAFASPTKTFGKAQNIKQDYTLANNGNIPINVGLSNVSSLADSDVTLVDNPQNNYDLALNLEADFNDNSPSDLVWGPLSLETPRTEVLPLDPYWGNASLANIFLSGEYFGPVSEVKKVAYNFTFTISEQ